MSFRNKTTGEYPIGEDTIRILNPNTSFPLNFTEAEGYDWVISTPQPVYDNSTQYIIEGMPQEINGIWNQVWEVKSYTTEQIAERQLQHDTEAKTVNKDRAMGLLSETDWTQMPDVALVNKADFTAYRAALRAIAITPPVNVGEWPTKPEEIWS